MDVIDLCCGDGWFTLPIANAAGHVIAIDIDADLLEAARYRLIESGVTNCDFVAGDAYELAVLVSRPADFIFMANAFHGVPDRPRLAAWCRARSAGPAGRFAIVNWHQCPRETTTVQGEPRGPRTELRAVTRADHSSGRGGRPQARRTGRRSAVITTAPCSN